MKAKVTILEDNTCRTCVFLHACRNIVLSGALLPCQLAIPNNPPVPNLRGLGGQVLYQEQVRKPRGSTAGQEVES